MEKKWAIAEKKSEDLLTQLLLNRHLVDEVSQKEFVNPTPPLTLAAKDAGLFGVDRRRLAAAASLVEEAVASGRTVIIHGDYDVDGLCATAILWETLYFGWGYKNVHPFIPDRFTDGYGLSVASLEKIYQQFNNETMKQPLLITVDCGITAAREVAYAQELGMDVVIVDHHSRPTVLPNAQGLVWSNKVCAATLAWLLSGQLLPGRNEAQLDLVALATLADLQTLLGVNRSLAKAGLEVLNSRPRLGLQILLEIAGLTGKEIGTYEVSWVVAPRLNAAGRLENALDALRLLCTHDLVQARELTAGLNRLNAERQRMTVTMVEHARVNYQAVEQSGNRKGKFILVHHESYHEGVIGLVAGKLAQEFHRPALVLAKGEVYAKGSARSVPGFDMMAALRKLNHLFEDLGGHPMAAGFTIKNENLSVLEGELARLVADELDESLLQPVLEIEAEIPFATVNRETAALLGQLEPYGLGNPEPVFLTRRAKAAAAQAVGAEGRHLKLYLEREGQVFPAIWFGEGKRLSAFPQGALIDTAYVLREDRWDGRSGVSLQIRDARLLSGGHS